MRDVNFRELITLVIDKDEISQHEMCDLMRSYGIDRLLCSTEMTASVNMIRNDPGAVDLVLARYEENSYDLVKGIKEANPEIIILMYSSGRDVTTHAKALIIGSSDYFKKEPGFEEKVHDKLQLWVSIAARQQAIYALEK